MCEETGMTKDHGCAYFKDDNGKHISAQAADDGTHVQNCAWAIQLVKVPSGKKISQHVHWSPNQWIPQTNHARILVLLETKNVMPKKNVNHWYVTCVLNTKFTFNEGSSCKISFDIAKCKVTYQNVIVMTQY